MQCPDPGKLEAFSLGSMPAAEFEEIAAHVVDCARCDEALATGRASDDVLARLRDLAAPDLLSAAADRAALAIPARLHERLLAARGAEPPIDPGRALANALRAGSCRLGKFVLEAELGVGSFGCVFRARDTELDRIVALKVERGGGLASHDDVNRFLREARSAARLKHPGIVALHESGQTADGVCYLVFEYVEGKTLESVLESARMAPARAVDCAIQLADARAYAQSQGVIHRDIKPANIMIDGDGDPHIMDFGLAKRESGDKPQTADGMLLGTPAYMSPEQARGDVNVDARSDLYSLGVILYEALTGERPFQGTRRMLLLQVLEAEPRAPRRLNGEIPRDLETICMKAMAKEPETRYANPRELGDDLRRFRAGLPIAARPLGLLGRAWAWSRRNPIAVSLLIAISCGAFGGLWYLSSLSRYFVEQTALRSADLQAAMLEELNTLYSEIVERLDAVHVARDGNYSSPNQVMIPAGFTIEAGRRISAGESGMQVRLYSDYPFPWRKDGGPRDEFEARALAELRAAPATSVYEFTELDGNAVVRFATARRMKESCIGCHNGHAESPKRDWSVGDVRGVLEIVRPLDQDIARVRAGLAGAFVLTGGITLVLLALSILLMRARRGRFLPQAKRGEGVRE